MPHPTSSHQRRNNGPPYHDDSVTTATTAAKNSTSDDASSRKRPRDNNDRAAREAARRAEMERLRAENEHEERQLLRQPSDHPAAAAPAPKPQEEIVQVEESELEGLDEDEQMRKLLGIEGFGSTKGTKVETNHNGLAAGAANKAKRRKYRQYMNRKGGFNRPLDKMS